MHRCLNGAAPPQYHYLTELVQPLSDVVSLVDCVQRPRLKFWCRSHVVQPSVTAPSLSPVLEPRTVYLQICDSLSRTFSVLNVIWSTTYLIFHFHELTSPLHMLTFYTASAAYDSLKLSDLHYITLVAYEVNINMSNKLVGGKEGSLRSSFLACPFLATCLRSGPSIWRIRTVL